MTQRAIGKCIFATRKTRDKGSLLDSLRRQMSKHIRIRSALQLDQGSPKTPCREGCWCYLKMWAYVLTSLFISAECRALVQGFAFGGMRCPCFAWWEEHIGANTKVNSIIVMSIGTSWQSVERWLSCFVIVAVCVWVVSADVQLLGETREREREERERERAIRESSSERRREG